MSLVTLLDGLIVILLGALVVLEILRPRRLRHLMDEVDRRTEAATEALDAAQRRLERTMAELAEQEHDEPPAPESRPRERGSRYRNREEADPQGEEIELDTPVSGGSPEPQARSLREKIAALLEDSGSQRTDRERRLLRQLQDTLDRPPGGDRFEQEKALYQALEAAAEEAGPRSGGEPPDEERELIAKLRREARR
jgi:hypothetical protein